MIHFEFCISCETLGFPSPLPPPPPLPTPAPLPPCLCMSNCFSTICWKGYPSFIDMLFTHLSEIIWTHICGSISGFSILFYWSVCLSLCQYHHLDYHSDNKSWNWVDWVPPLFSSFQKFFVYYSSFASPYTSEGNLVCIYKKPCWDFDRNCVNLCISLERTGIFTSVSLLTMKVVCLSIYLDLWFFKSGFYHFQHFHFILKHCKWPYIFNSSVLVFIASM